jgi:acyl-CoA thioester hydrolase
MTTSHSSAAAPLLVAEVPVDPAWINASGHMNAGQYIAVFEQAFHGFIDSTGRASADCAPFLMEMHTCYIAEAARGDGLVLHVQVLGATSVRLHLLLTMTRRGRGDLIATTELDVLSIDLATRKPGPWPAQRHERLTELANAHRDLVVPKQVGRAIRRLST